MKKRSAIIFSLLFLAFIAMFFLYSNSADALSTCTGGTFGAYIGCSGIYPNSDPSVGSCWYAPTIYWPNGTIKYNPKAIGLEAGVWCGDYNYSNCDLGSEYCLWYPHLDQPCSTFNSNESGCLSESPYCTPIYDSSTCVCTSPQIPQLLSTAYSGCNGTYTSTANNSFCAGKYTDANGKTMPCDTLYNYTECMVYRETCSWVTNTYSIDIPCSVYDSDEVGCSQTSGCTPVYDYQYNCTFCGNNQIDTNEPCDYTASPSTLGQTCSSVGLGVGTVSCTNSCTLNTTQCSAATCSDTDSPTINYTQKGTISSNSGISTGTDFCFKSSSWGVPSTAGDMLMEYFCSSDSGTSNYFTCANFGPDMYCNDGRCVNSTFVTSPYCGNGILQTNIGEDCEGTNLNGQTCSSLGLGFNAGTLSCTPSCQFNTSLCSNKILDCQVGCNADSDCLSGQCRIDDIGTKRCVPAASTCAVALNSSCGRDLDYKQCSGTTIYTCLNTGNWGSQSCALGCNLSSSPLVCNIANVWWALWSDLTKSISNEEVNKDFSFKMVWQAGTGGDFDVFKVGQYDPVVTGIPGSSTSEKWVGIWNFLISSLPEGTSALYYFKVNDSITSYNLNLTHRSATYCGDGDVTPPGEECDGTNLSGNNCTTISGGFNGGNLSCFPPGNAYECQFDNSNCTLPVTGKCGDGQCLVGENYTNCPADCPTPTSGCDLISTCVDYNSTNAYSPIQDCTQDLCNVSLDSPVAGQPGSCTWDYYSGLCYKESPSVVVNGTAIGSCATKEGPRTDDCSDGFLSYNWSGTWTWDSNNCYTGLPAGANQADYFLDGTNGCNYRYDPNGDSISCQQPGFATVACPAQVELSFFDWRNLIAAVILIFVLYILLMKKKKTKLKVHSKPKKSSPKGKK